MTNSSLTEVFLEASNAVFGALVVKVVAEYELHSGAKGESYDIERILSPHSDDLKKQYALVVASFNMAGEELAKRGLAFERIDYEASFRKVYDELVEKYRSSSSSGK